MLLHNKLGKEWSITLSYRNISWTGDYIRQTTDTKFFYCSFKVLEVQNLQKKFQLNRKTRCQGYSNYVRRLLYSSCFYKMKEALRLGGSAPPDPPGWGWAADPAFPQWHKLLDALISQYTKLKTNREVILVNICILETNLCHFL